MVLRLWQPQPSDSASMKAPAHAQGGGGDRDPRRSAQPVPVERSQRLVARDEEELPKHLEVSKSLKPTAPLEFVPELY